MQCRRYGEARGPCTPFPFTQNTVFETFPNDKTTDNDGNERIIPFKHNFRLVFSNSLRIAGNQLVFVNVTQ